MIKRVIYILFFLLFLQGASAINVVFRLDDPSLQADSVSLRALQLFNEKQVPLSIAVVPCDAAEQPIVPITAEDSLYLAELQSDNIELALHGLTHENINHQGEFGGLNYTEAQRRIRIGEDALREYTSQKISTFIPPVNVFNDSTLLAMMDNGLYILSADMHSYIYCDGIQYYPETLGHLMKQKGIWQAAEDAIFGCKQKDAICVVMFHAYDLPDEASWLRLGALLDACKADKDVQLHTFRSLYESGNTSTQYRYRANQLHSLLQKHLLHSGVLHTTWLCWLVHVLNALIYALLPLVLLVGWFRQRKPLWLIAAIVGCLVFGGMAMWSVMGPMKLLAVDMVYVAIVGMILWGVSKVGGKK